MIHRLGHAILAAMIVCLTGCAMTKQFSLPEVQNAFANAPVRVPVKVIAYVPSQSDPTKDDPNSSQDVSVWLNREPGWANQSVLWVCASNEQAVLLAQKRSQALANTNMGDIYGGPPGWVARSQTEVEALREKAFVRLEPGKSIGQIPVGARRFVMRNLVLEAAPMPRDAANQVRTEVLVKQLEAMRLETVR